MDRFHFADATTPNEFAREVELPEHTRPLLAAGLKDPVVFAHRLYAKLLFADRQRERFLAINIFAAFACFDDRNRVPVVGRGNQDLIDVFAPEDRP